MYIFETLALAASKRRFLDVYSGCAPIPSLCQLFLANHCRFGSQCRQVHADLTIVTKLRAEWTADQARPHCCMEHTASGSDRERKGSPSDTSLLSMWLSERTDADNNTSPEAVEQQKGHEHQQLKHVCLRLHPGNGDSPTTVDVPLLQFSVTRGLHMAVVSSNSSSMRNDMDSNATTMRLDVTVPLCKNHGYAGGERCRFDRECRFLHVCLNVLREMHVSGRPSCGGLASEIEYPSVDSLDDATSSNDAIISPSEGDGSQQNDESLTNVFLVTQKQPGAGRTPSLYGCVLTATAHPSLTECALDSPSIQAHGGSATDSPGKCIRRLRNGSFGWSHDPYASSPSSAKSPHNGTR
eukprot:CAMPEP_0176411152 /NCGR_PEP_ID=MMETSP0127-20121128/3451_1 /TAXON_ID=938130 /ORGANISM="Platyophrya macrostoma, Strain WH" /LENGTH=352 /DNA_ID=CAMNT_0017790723 /DNA_START=304 /DNA_END=1362 /DNA_ORIENTATION=-